MDRRNCTKSNSRSLRGRGFTPPPSTSVSAETPAWRKPSLLSEEEEEELEMLVDLQRILHGDEGLTYTRVHRALRQIKGALPPVWRFAEWLTAISVRSEAKRLITEACLKLRSVLSDLEDDWQTETNALYTMFARDCKHIFRGSSFQ